MDRWRWHNEVSQHATVPFFPFRRHPCKNGAIGSPVGKEEKKLASLPRGRQFPVNSPGKFFEKNLPMQPKRCPKRLANRASGLIRRWAVPSSDGNEGTNQSMKAIPGLLAATAVFVFQAAAAPVPLQLPRPDGKPGTSDKPVKVYILAGQSNTVGMGELSHSSPPYPRVYLSADPAILPGAMPVGTSRTISACRWIWKGIPALRAHGVHQSADAAAPAGATVALHKGAYDPKADYAKLSAAKTTTMPLGTVSSTVPTLDGPCTAVASAFIDVPASGNYLVHVGYGESTHALATLDGRQVYRKEVGGKPVLTKATLEAGKRYPLRITYFQGGSAALWLEQVDLVGKGDLVTLTKKDGKFPYLIDDAGNWTARNDVYFQEARLIEGGKGCPLSADANKKCLPKCDSIGPEVGFGFVMGTFHDEQVLVIKTSHGQPLAEVRLPSALERSRGPRQQI